MGSSNDTVQLDAQAASNGIGGWELATKSFDTRFNAALQAVKDAHAKTPWGSDEPGQTFKGQYTGTEFPTDKAQVETVNAIRDLAGNARKAVGLNVQADTDQGTRIDKSKGKLDGADPGAAGGGGAAGGSSGGSGASGAGDSSSGGSSAGSGLSAGSSSGGGSSGAELGSAQFASSVGGGQGEFLSQVGSNDAVGSSGDGGEWLSQAASTQSGAQLASFASSAVTMPALTSVGQLPEGADKDGQAPSLAVIADQVASLEQALGLSGAPPSGAAPTVSYAAEGGSVAPGSGTTQSGSAGGGGPTITMAPGDGSSSSSSVASSSVSGGGNGGTAAAGMPGASGAGGGDAGAVVNSASGSASGSPGGSPPSPPAGSPPIGGVPADGSVPAAPASSVGSSGDGGPGSPGSSASASPAGPGAPMAPPMSPGAGGGGGPMPGAGARSHGDPERRQRSAAYGDEDDSLFTTGTPAATLPIVRSAERSVPQQELLSEDHFGVTPSTPPVAPAEPAGPPTDDQPDSEPEAVEAQSGSQPPRESVLRRAH